MALSDLFSLEKLTIKAFDKVERDGKVHLGKAVDSFEALININSFSKKYHLKYQKTGGINTSKQEAVYSKTLPEHLSFQIIIDNTGAFGGIDFDFIEPESVIKKVEHFLEVCYKYQGEIHSPRFLKVEWGELRFECKLLSLNVNYTLFDKGGKPIRAELDVVFIEDISNEKGRKLEGKQSPDITHSQLFKAGDSLPLMSRKIYGSSEYYIQIAKINDIDHFRDIELGREIKFPPLEELKKY